MRIIHAFLSIGLTAVMTGSVSGQAAEQPFALTITTESPTVKAGSRVYLIITQTNTTDRAIDCSEDDIGSTDMSYIYDVRNEKGQEVPKRNSGDIPPDFRYTVSCGLGSGNSLTGKYLISWLVNFDKPGKYTIQVSRPISSNQEGMVKSNTIALTVTK